LAWTIIREAWKNDVIFVQGALVVGCTSALIAKLLGKPLILKFVGDEVWEEALRKRKTNLELENFLGEPKKSYLVFLEQWVQAQTLRLASKIVVPSHYLKNLLRKFYRINESEIEVIENAVEIPVMKRRPTTNKKVIVSSGRLVPHKRFDLLILAFGYLLELLPKDMAETIELQIIGEGRSMEALRATIEQLNLLKKVKLIGRRNKQAYFHRLRKASIFVIASSYEGLPHAIIEAMLSEVPVVASDIPGNREVIDHGTTGLLTKATTKDLAEAMKRIFVDQEFATKTARNAKRNARKRFSWKTHIERLVHLLG
jgi:glycosyltransferase involved in cell wall biosynthesis